MGNENNHSVARKRLSTLAITTTLAAVGVGVVGTGAANAATTSPTGHSQEGTQAVTSAAAVKVTPGTGATSLTATADLSGTKVDPGSAAKASITISWDGVKDSQKIDFNTTTGLPMTGMVPHVYTAAGTYNVTVTVDDGSGKAVTPATAPVTVTDATLAASLSPSTTKKNSEVTLALTGSSVDQSIKAAKTTVDWGDKTTVASFPGDPALIKVADPKLMHSYTADGNYTVTVTLDDGLGTKTSAQTKTIAVTVSEGIAVLRASGDDRYGTGLAISRHQWANTGVATDTRTQAKNVVLATGNDFADALVGVPLAKKMQAPLLLTDGSLTTINAQVLTEIKRVLPADGKIYLLGGDVALNAKIESQLKSLGYTTQRLAGDDRFATSLVVANVGMNNPSHLVVARGDEGKNHDGFADALTAGPYAADVWGGGNSAVVLTNFAAFDPATKAYVQSKLKAGQKNVAAIGGQATAAMTTIMGSSDTYDFTYGATRYETAAKVAQAFEPVKAKNAPIGVATGLLFPDALTGGAYMASTNGPLLLTDPKVLSTATAAEIADVAKTTPQVSIFGGEKAVAPAVATAIAKLVNVATIGKF